MSENERKRETDGKMIQQKGKDEDNDNEDGVVQMRRDTEMEMSERTITRKLKTRHTYTRSIAMKRYNDNEQYFLQGHGYSLNMTYKIKKSGGEDTSYKHTEYITLNHTLKKQT